MNAVITDKYTNEQYHALPSISKSGLDLIAKSPAHFKAGFQGIGADTARIGTGVHSVILEGGKDLIVAPDRKRASNADKEFWDEWFAENGVEEPIATVNKAADWFPIFEHKTGKTIIKPNEMQDINNLRDSVMSNELAASLLSVGVAEQSILFQHNDTDCRVRPDWMTANHCLVDIKSTADASYRGFRTSCAKYRYNVQHAMYSQGYYAATNKWPEFYFIAVEKKPPFLNAVYKLDERAVENGAWLFERDLETYKQCKESGIWTGFPNDLELNIPIYEEETFDLIIDGEMVAA